MAPEHKDITIARIQARSAILIAMATGLIGLLGGLAWKPEHQGPPGAKPDAGQAGPAIEGDATIAAPRQRWLEIRGIRRLVNPPGAVAAPEMRLVVNIGGIPFAYPADAAWTKLGADMSSQRIPIPMGHQGSITFVLWLKEGASAVSFHRREPVTMSFENAGQDRIYQLNRVVGGVKEAEAEFEIRYAFFER